LRDARGYTLVEMMIGIGIAIVVGMGLYQVFTATQRSSVGQRLRNDVQTGCTAAMDQIKSELALGGYRAVDTATPISNASAGSITFEYWDDHAEPLVGHNNNTRVTYRRATTAETGGGPDGIKPGDLVRESYRYATPSGPFDTTPTKQVLVDNVLSLGFTYMQSDNTPWDGISLGGIKTIRPTLTCESSREDPVSKQTLKITLTGEVRARRRRVSRRRTPSLPQRPPTSWPGTRAAAASSAALAREHRHRPRGYVSTRSGSGGLRNAPGWPSASGGCQHEEFTRSPV
jgi:type II secretory pathway pseudopilin PulG